MARQCGCGRTLNKPFCDGSHTLTEKQFEERTRQIAEEELALYQQQAMDLWFKDGSCTGGEITREKK